MSFPNVIYGHYGMEKETSTSKKRRFGTKLVLPDGRVFYYGSAGEAITAGKITKLYGDKGIPEDSLKINFEGSAGQSFGAFLSKGIHFNLKGDAND